MSHLDCVILKDFLLLSGLSLDRISDTNLDTETVVFESICHGAVASVKGLFLYPVALINAFTTVDDVLGLVVRDRSSVLMLLPKVVTNFIEELHLLFLNPRQFLMLLPFRRR